MNLTLSIDDELLRKARALASRRGLSLQALIRDHLRALVGDVPAEDAARELLDLMEQAGGHSGGRRIGRDEAYEELL
jgi:hypothetical protein